MGAVLGHGSPPASYPQDPGARAGGAEAPGGKRRVEVARLVQGQVTITQNLRSIFLHISNLTQFPSVS